MWGADTASVQSPESKNIYRSTDVYADPHTKCFLLIQGYLEKVREKGRVKKILVPSLAHITQIPQARLPISDYINDTRSVMDNVPRLLAAMHFIGSKEFQVEGFLEVVSQLFRTKQLLATKSTVCFSLYDHSYWIHFLTL
jgi:hypothetical protein